jgi:hypothetical protein
MNVHATTIVILSVLSMTCPFDVAAREWTDATGKHRVEAELIDFTEGVVRLRKADGQVIEMPLEKLSPADQRHLREEKPPVGRPQRDGFLVETEDGLYYVDLNGKSEPFAKTRKVVGRPAVQGSRVFIPVEGAIREFNARGRLVRAIAITKLEKLGSSSRNSKWMRQELSHSRLFVLPRGDFALLSPGGFGTVYFIDHRGASQRTVKIPRQVTMINHLGTVADGGLLVSNIFQRDVMRVDLKRYWAGPFMQSDRSLGPIAFDPQREIYYVCSGAAIHAVSMKGNREQPNVSQAPKIATVEARFRHSTTRPHFISGIALDGEFAYVTLSPYDCIVKVNVATGDSELFVEGLTHPGTIVRLKESN